jgi:hypothetical protein
MLSVLARPSLISRVQTMLSNSTQQARSRATTQPRDQAHRARLAPERERRWTDRAGRPNQIGRELRWRIFRASD